MFHSKLQVSIFVNFSTIWTEPSEFVTPAKYATLTSGGSVQYAASTLVAHTIHNNNNNNSNNYNNKIASNGLWIDLCNVVAQPTSHHRSLSGGRVTCAKTPSILWSGATQNKTAKKLHTYHSINVHLTWQLVIAADICSLPAETSLRISTQAKEGQEGELM